MSEKFDQTDEMITRERTPRTILAIASLVITPLVGYMSGVILASYFRAPLIVGSTLGLCLGAFIAIWLLSRSYIKNDAVSAFVTIDPLATAFCNGNPLVSYGPGFHFCYFWETRSGGNNVSLAEAAENFTAIVQVASGRFTVKYSVRLRPDITLLPEFLSGVASVSAEIGGIISAKIVDYMKNKTLTEAITKLAELNEFLKNEFAFGKSGDERSPLEKRFGIKVGDVTAEEILPSEEVQKTMSAVTEAQVIDEIVAKSFGFDDVKTLNTAIREEKIPEEEVNRRRTQTMAMSGNLQGMELKEHTFNLHVKGLDELDPAAATALAAGLGMFAQHKATNPQRPKGGK